MGKAQWSLGLFGGYGNLGSSWRSVPACNILENPNSAVSFLRQLRRLAVRRFEARLILLVLGQASFVRQVT